MGWGRRRTFTHHDQRPTRGPAAEERKGAPQERLRVTERALTSRASDASFLMTSTPAPFMTVVLQWRRLSPPWLPVVLQFSACSQDRPKGKRKLWCAGNAATQYLPKVMGRRGAKPGTYLASGANPGLPTDKLACAWVCMCVYVCA